MHRLYFVIGASGVGKTTAMKALEKRRPDIIFHHFDPIGVPPVEKMVKENLSGEEWQRQMTIEWVKRIKVESLYHAPVILDGQTRQSFIEEACRLEGLSDYKIILFHCEDAVRDHRVITRGHPELANSKTANWAKHLRQWALNRGDAIIDTTALTIEEAADELQRQISAS
jgi:RNase adaptor protein for sRNA GlmZ degradation